MKIFVLIFASLGSTLAFAVTPDFTAYVRAGTGSNGKGAAMECYSNKGAAAGNEFRLGNECGIYGEFQFGAHLLKSEGDKAPFWRLASTLAFQTKNSTDFETSNSANTADGNPTNWIVREMYTEAGNIDGTGFSVWAGKRFYLWNTSHMDDFNAIEMSGPGAGIGDITTSAGKFSMALIQNSESYEFGQTTNIANNKGRAAKTSLNLRLEDLETGFGNFSFWLAGGLTSPATATTGGTEYKAANGTMFSVRHTLKGDYATNDFGLAYGTSVMSNFTARGDLVTDCTDESNSACTVSKSSRVRAWETYSFDLNRWSAEVSLIYDDYNKGNSQNSRVRWTSIGARPIYWLTDHMSLVFEAGMSSVQDDSDGLGTRTLNRYTIAPQLSLGKGYSSRPVIRAFYTHNAWNDANRVSFTNTSVANDTSAHTVGVQTEVWF